MRKWLVTMSAVMFATTVAAQTLPSPTFRGATVKKATTPSIMLDSATTDTSINSIFGQRQGLISGAWASEAVAASSKWSVMLAASRWIIR